MQDAIRSQAAKNERAVLLTEWFGEIESFDRCSQNLSAWLYRRHLTLILRRFRQPRRSRTSIRKFRFGPLSRASYSSPALDTICHESTPHRDQYLPGICFRVLLLALPKISALAFRVCAWGAIARGARAPRQPASTPRSPSRTPGG